MSGNLHHCGCEDQVGHTKELPNEFHLQQCCTGVARTFEETLDGRLPPSNHAPSCPSYKTEKFPCIVPKGECGPVLVVETRDDADAAIAEYPEEYDVSEIEMTRDQFERLGAFDGF
jgi:hypothetical protein